MSFKLCENLVLGKRLYVLRILGNWWGIVYDFGGFSELTWTFIYFVKVLFFFFMNGLAIYLYTFDCWQRKKQAVIIF